MPRKHLIASSTNKKQQANAKVLQKLAKEIKAAVKVGGTNIEANTKLKFAVEKALDNNLSRESIEKNIFGSKNDAELQEFDFEGFGPNGLAIVIHAVSDNINRVAGNIRGYFTKINGQIAKPGSAILKFSSKGQIYIDKEIIDENDLLNKLLDENIEDLISTTHHHLLICSPDNFISVKNRLKNENIDIDEALVGLYAFDKIEINSKEEIEKMEKFFLKCEDDEDIV